MPIYAGGTDHAVYEAAGAEQLLAAREKIGILQRGDIAVTPAFALKAKFIIHVCGPIWEDGQSGEYTILQSCYEKSLIKAAELKCASIAFPLIATGINGFPKDKALQIAINTISSFLMDHEMKVILVVFSNTAFELSSKIFTEVTSFIDDMQVQKRLAAEYGEFTPEYERIHRYHRPLSSQAVRDRYDNRTVETPEQQAVPMALPNNEDELETMLKVKSETFQQCLFRMIDERGLKDQEVYFRANLDRKLFSKIRCNPDYHPKKKTALAFAIALQLDMNETIELLSKAEWALSPSNKFDLIVAYCISHRYYEIYQINAILHKYHQNELGA